MRMRKHLAAVAALAALVTGCGTDTAGARSGTQSGADVPGAFSHVHGLGVNLADGRLYVASHLGVFKQTSDGFERIADRYQDTMAFTVTGPDRFLASGHPDLREDKPPHLGLIKSTDAARTWSSVSMEGEADFHALEPAGDLLYGYDSNNGVLKVTRNLRTWQDIAHGTFVDVAVDPVDPARVLVTDSRGRLLELSRDTTPVRVPGPRLVLLDWPSRALLVGLAQDGTLYRSADAGASWDRVSSLGSVPQALHVTGRVWHVATENGLFASNDAGVTWVRVRG